METRGQCGSNNSCWEHPSEDVKGYCRDCQIGVCFRCAVGKHRNHGVANIDEIEKKDVETMITASESKIDMLREKAMQIMDKARNAETHQDKIPEIDAIFAEIAKRFQG
jgi:hypothetical protein